jgi:hypothetical protein
MPGLPRGWVVKRKREAHPIGARLPFLCRRFERYSDFAQSHPPPQRQPGLQAQRSPQLQGSTGALAHPHEAF